MANKQAIFLEGNLLRHISIMSASASIGLVSMFLVDFADLLFISMLGEQELAAAVGFCRDGPVLHLFCFDWNDDCDQRARGTEAGAGGC